MKIRNYEKRVISDKGLKADENKEEPESYFLKCRPFGRFVRDNFRR
jgi:hypothetical protein